MSIFEQRYIVAKVDELMALVDALGIQLADSRATGKGLLEALVTDLTSQTTGLEKYQSKTSKDHQLAQL